MYGLSSFFIGEQRRMSSGRLFAPSTEEMKIFLSTQIADEARHVRFFDRFYSEVRGARVAHARLEAQRRARTSTQPSASSSTGCSVRARATSPRIPATR